LTRGLFRSGILSRSQVPFPSDLAYYDGELIDKKLYSFWKPETTPAEHISDGAIIPAGLAERGSMPAKADVICQ
jgi:hypothetical protein